MVKKYSLHTMSGGNPNAEKHNERFLSKKDEAADTRMAKNFLFETFDIVLLVGVFVVTIVFPIAAAWYAKKAYDLSQSVSSANPTIDFGELVNDSKLTFDLSTVGAVVAFLALMTGVWRFWAAKK